MESALKWAHLGMLLPHDNLLLSEYIYLEYLLLIFLGEGGILGFATFLVSCWSKRFKKKPQMFKMLIKFTAASYSLTSLYFKEQKGG